MWPLAEDRAPFKLGEVIAAHFSEDEGQIISGFVSFDSRINAGEMPRLAAGDCSAVGGYGIRKVSFPCEQNSLTEKEFGIQGI